MASHLKDMVQKVRDNEFTLKRSPPLSQTATDPQSTTSHSPPSLLLAFMEEKQVLPPGCELIHQTGSLVNIRVFGLLCGFAYLLFGYIWGSLIKDYPRSKNTF